MMCKVLSTNAALVLGAGDSIRGSQSPVGMWKIHVSESGDPADEMPPYTRTVSLVLRLLELQQEWEAYVSVCQRQSQRGCDCVSAAAPDLPMSRAHAPATST